MTLYANLAGLPEPVALPGDRRLTDCLAAVLNGWRFDLAATAERPAFASIERRRRGFRLTSRWLEEPSMADSDVGVLTSLVVDLGYAFAAAAPGRLCLHAGAVELGGRLVVFPSASKSGKSTLIAALAMAGTRVFADDLLPIEGAPACGIALGTRPRLRLPLARGVGEPFRRFVRAHAGPADEENQFLKLPPQLHAAHGESAPIGAFVMLDRRRDGPAEITAADVGAGLRSIVLQNLATPSAADAVFGRLRALVEAFPCFTLSYARLDDAVALLRERFADWSAGDIARPSGSEAAEAGHLGKGSVPIPSLRSAADDAGEHAGVVPSEPHGGEGRASGLFANASRGNEDRFHQNPAATLHEVGGETFLVHPAADGIYALDAVALIVWKLLATPASRADLAGLLCELFPDAEPARIRGDVAALLRDLGRRGLVVNAGGRSEKKKGAPRGRPSRRTLSTAQTE